MTLGLLGLKKDIDISIREEFSITVSKKKEIIKELLKFFNEVIILNTCNRTEIYVYYDNFNKENIINIIFDTLKWDKSLQNYIFFKKDKEVSKHLFELACGFHSKILGEDQILGQIRDAYKDTLSIKSPLKVLGRMFETSIACSRKFKNEARLYEIPVSSISIVAEKFSKMNCKKIMVLGYGNIGKLAVKYLLQNNISLIYLVVRNKKSANNINDSRVKVITFKEKNKFINDVQGIIGCTKAPHAVVLQGDIKEKGDFIYCFDMAIPRDIHKSVLELNRVKVYNIDEISSLDYKNKKLRQERMIKFKYIVKEYLEEFNNYMKIKEITPDIKKIKENSNEVYKRRFDTYCNKRQNLISISGYERDKILVEKLIKSTSDYYLNRAINILKEEKLKGCEEECIRIIKKIFQKEKK